MKLCAISDVHGYLPDNIPECDVLLIAGDLAPDQPFSRTYFDPDWMRAGQMKWLSSTYYDWEQRVPAKHILMTPGNHDWFTRMPEHCRTRFFVDEGCEIDGVTFYFTPWIPPVGGWNYMLPRGDRKARFADIPPRVDVLISHSPPFGCLDKTYGGDRIGCPELREAILQKKPKFVLFGHCHEGIREGRSTQLGDSLLRNVAMRSSDVPVTWYIPNQIFGGSQENS